MTKNPPNKALTDQQVLAMREEYAKGKKGYNYFAKLHNISKPTARSAILGITYKHVANPCVALNPDAMSDVDIRARQRAAIVAARKEKRTLTCDQVIEMRKEFRLRLHTGRTMREIAGKYNLSVAAAYYAIIGRTYTDVPHAVNPDLENLRIPARYRTQRSTKPKEKSVPTLRKMSEPRPRPALEKVAIPNGKIVLSTSEILAKLAARRNERE